MSILTDNAKYQAWCTANHKRFQWHALDYMRWEAKSEIERRANGITPNYWPDRDTAYLERVIARITRAMDCADEPDFVPGWELEG
jgi:hypothetical protein